LNSNRLLPTLLPTASATARDIPAAAAAQGLELDPIVVWIAVDLVVVWIWAEIEYCGSRPVDLA
jgi:hypothetical protein